MKQKLPRKLLMAFCFTAAVGVIDNGAIAATRSFAMIRADRADIKVTGTVTDKAGIPIPGVSVQVKNSKAGTTTDADGKFNLSVADNAILIFQSIGFKNVEVPVNGRTSFKVALEEDSKVLNEVVVIGYGTAKKKDLTGSIISVSAKDFNKGPIVNPEQLISGKVAGVQITSLGGEPGAASRIRIRGAASLTASSDPLIVVDGVPLDNITKSDGTSSTVGAASPLSFINPNDIESFNILKDASATAIYGSRASNGVILITTKKGNKGDKLNVSFSSLESVSQKTGTLDVLSPDQLRAAVMAYGTTTQQDLLGQANTNWQDYIYQNAISHDNNLSLSGGIKNLPYRLSLGYLDQAGILKTSDLKRSSASLSLSPKLFDDHLKIDLNLKGAFNKSRFANTGAIGAAAAFDPTQPVFEKGNPYGGYFETLDAGGNLNTLAPRNPLSLLEQNKNLAYVNRTIDNLQLDYKFHFLPELRANLNVGYDYSKSEGKQIQPVTAAPVFTQGGQINQYAQTKKNKLLEFYLNYVKEVKSIQSRFDATGGYSYQDWFREEPLFGKFSAAGAALPLTGVPVKTQNTLLSFYGRLNYAFMDRYLLTATIRRDGSSRFAADNRWGMFPSVAFAWKINEESFLKDSKVLSDLKLRVGYGVTGQQDIFNDYPYLARYTSGDAGSQYQFGNTFYNTLRAEGYDPKIKWEQTATSNIALDYGFLNGKISGSLDFYDRKTSGLLSFIPVAVLSNLSNGLLTNVGNIENKGVELVINANPVRTQNFNWDLGFNVSHNESKITNLTKVPDPNFIGVPTGGISGGVGNTVQIHSVGYAPNSFYVYKQVYNNAGKPIEGVYADLNKDGVVNQQDLYRYKSPEPKVSLGFNSQFSYKQWNLGFALRANLGNYMYNNVSSNTGTYKSFSFSNYLTNVSADVLNTNFETYQLFSDYYVENASFLRMDNINLGYTFKNVLKNKVNLRVSANAQNVFVITKYKGLDPEFAGTTPGIDNNFYPRARVVSMGVNLDF